jgi:hypothetical protein
MKKTGVIKETEKTNLKEFHAGREFPGFPKFHVIPPVP